LENETTVAIDPRTLNEVVQEADCHLIPECFRVSNVTVRLDGLFDSKIGTTCDSELQRYFVTLVGTHLEGHIALDGGSESLASVFSVGDGALFIPKPRTGKAEDWATRALGLRDGRVLFRSFKGKVVDCARAYLSMVHSAFLILYRQVGQDVFDSTFDQARSLFRKAVNGLLTNADYEPIRDMVEVDLYFDSRRVKSDRVRITEFRRFYDPAFDAGDGVLNDFPNKCVSTTENQWKYDCHTPIVCGQP
jgi:hypothetical protein